ncbi:MAG: DUF1559 domain-containing protein [Thermoguttaceae bacterium]
MQFRLSTLLLLFVVLWSSLAVFGVGGIFVLFLLVVASMIIARSWAVFLGFLVVVAVIAFLLSALPNVREAARKAQCNNNLHQIALALFNYEKANGCYPPAYIADKTGRPMHSWRVLILPYLGSYNSLYRQYSFDEPWGGPNNKKLLAARPQEYACPCDTHDDSPEEGQTSYVAVVGPNAAWSGKRSKKAVDLAPSDATIMVVETTGADVGWTEPRDLIATGSDATDASPSTISMSSQHGNRSGFFYTYHVGVGAHAAFADGSTRYLVPECVPRHLRAKYLRIGGYDQQVADAEEHSTSPLPAETPKLNLGNCCALAIWLATVGLFLFRAARSRKPKQAAGNSPA